MKSKGFTLIEFIIVVAILSILAAIAIPNFMEFQCKLRAREAGIKEETSIILCNECLTGCNDMTYSEVIKRIVGGQKLDTILEKDFEADEIKIFQTCDVACVSEKAKVKQLTDKVFDLERQLNQCTIPVKQNLPVGKSWKQ